MNSDFEECNIDDEHARTIVHIDIDCFYAQVEMNKNPKLRTEPLGIQQKNIIVTCNYAAREKNVRKVMPVSEALKVCPDLVLVNGEDLQEYRRVSNHLNDLVRNKYTHLIEKIGFDECFIDVSELVKNYIAEHDRNDAATGHMFGGNYEKCQCGCDARLIAGSKIAQEIRDTLFADLNLTSSAGISYNKLLAKLAAGYRKPNNQTVLFASNVKQFMLECPLRKIPGIGEKIYSTLLKNKIESVKNLQNCDFNFLKEIFKNELAVKLFNYSFGKDNSLVKIQEKPQSIGLEDSFSAISERSKVKEKFDKFLNRLIVLINDDGRVPGCLKVTVRTVDAQTGSLKREQRQTNLASVQIFESKNDEISFAKNGHQKCLSVAMELFEKIIDGKKVFKVNLLGLSVTKLQNIDCLENNLLKKFVQGRSNINRSSLGSGTVISIDIGNDSDSENNHDAGAGTAENDANDEVECIRVVKRSLVSDLESSAKKQKKSNSILNYFAKKNC